MSEKILLSIEAVTPTRWVTDAATGAQFEVAPLPSDEDEAATQKHTDMLGRLNVIAFGMDVLVERGKLKAWRHVGAKASPAACSPENVKLLLTNQGRRLVPFLVGECRSIEHYRVEEVEAAKKD